MKTLDKKTITTIKKVSKVMGLSEKSVIERALSFYFNAIESELSLKREFTFWDYLSDEALSLQGF